MTRTDFVLLVIVVAVAMPLAGCPRSASSFGGGDAAPAIDWAEEGIEHRGAQISLGFRPTPAGERTIEPVVAIVRDGRPVASAMVFYRLVSPDGQQQLGEESATIYEPPSEQMPAYYGRKKLPLPAGDVPVSVRYRIVLPESEADWTKDVPIDGPSKP